MAEGRRKTTPAGKEKRGQRRVRDAGARDLATTSPPSISSIFPSLASSFPAGCLLSFSFTRPSLGRQRTRNSVPKSECKEKTAGDTPPNGESLSLWAHDGEENPQHTQRERVKTGGPFSSPGDRHALAGRGAAPPTASPSLPNVATPAKGQGVVYGERKGAPSNVPMVWITSPSFSFLALTLLQHAN